jgi:hypothetical protein
MSNLTETDDHILDLVQGNTSLGELVDGPEILARIERLEKLVKEKIEAPLVAAGKLPPPLPKRR